LGQKKHLLTACLALACPDISGGKDGIMKAGPMPRHDSVWEETPRETAAFMAEVTKPWIAYKVLGAGAIHPNEGFRYAFENGSDFLCVGMFDFQVAEDVEIARRALDRAQGRARAWCG